MVGRPLGPAPAGRSMLLLLVDLVSGDVRILDGPDPVLSLAPTRDGKSILAGSVAGDLNVVQVLSASGNPRVRTLFTCTNRVNYLDSGPDGTVYADQADRPTALVRFAASGGGESAQSNLNESSSNPGKWIAEGCGVTDPGVQRPDTYFSHSKHWRTEFPCMDRTVESTCQH